MSSNGVLVLIVGVLAIGSVIGVLILFFRDDKNRTTNRGRQQNAIEQPLKDRLGIYADIEPDQMTPEIESRMSETERRDWLSLQAIKMPYKLEQSMSVDFSSSDSLGKKLRRLGKMLAVAILLLSIYIVFMDEPNGNSSAMLTIIRVAIIVGALIYIIWLPIQFRLRGKRLHSTTQKEDTK